MVRRAPRCLALALLLAAVSAAAAERFVVEDWSAHRVGAKGLPAGWTKQNWGSPKYDFTIVDNDGRRVLHMKSDDEGSTASKDIKGRIDLKKTPVLEWSWKVVRLPKGADSRKKATDDQAAQVYVTWPRFPEAVRSRILGYVWDTTAPVGTVVKSEKTGTVTYIVVRSGTADTGRWVTERRNVAEDFKRVYGEEPEDPAAVSVAIDSNETRSTAEALVGAIVFTTP